MQDYFYTVFPGQLRQLSYSKSDHITNRVLRLGGVPFFGGPDWENVRTDLETVPASDRTRFVLALFMIVLTDQAVYTYNREVYGEWRDRTAFPKFGWTGFGAHFENPFKLLWAPEREGLVNPAQMIAAMPGFADFLVTETARVFAGHGLAISPERHFASILEDRAYAFGEGTVVPAFRAAFEQRLRDSKVS